MDTKTLAETEAQLEAAREAALPLIKAIKEKSIKDGGADGGELVLIETDIVGAELLAFRVPTSPEWHQYRIMIQNQDPTSKVDAINNLVNVCCVFPERGNFQRIVDAHPGITETCYADLQEHAGAARAKKAYKL